MTQETSVPGSSAPRSSAPHSSAPDGAPALAICGLRVRYPRGRGGEVVAVDGLDLEIVAGESVGLFGESGSGKSSVALAATGLARGDLEGEIAIAGRRVDRLGERAWRRLRGAEVGLVFQQPGLALHPLRRVGAQVVDVLRGHGRGSSRDCRAIAAERFADLELDAELLDAYPHQLSGGQRQRVVLAQALACDPPLLLADEPAASLDPKTAAAVLDRLAELRRRRGLALLFIDHDPDRLARITDRIHVIRNGRLVESGPTAEVLAAPRHAYSRALLASPSRPELPRSAPAAPADSTNGTKTRPILLEVRGLSVEYRRGGAFDPQQGVVRALDSVDLAVEQGSITALVGRSGGGKSTLARCLALLETPTAGEILFEGRPLSGLDRRALAEARRRVQLVFQDAGRSVAPHFDVERVVTEPLRVLGRPARERRARARELLAEVDLDPDLLSRPVLSLSGGQLRRLALARALAVEPRALVLDEALTGLDAPRISRLVDLLLDLRERHGLTYVLVSHDPRLVTRLADRVVSVEQGALREEGR